MAASLHRGRGVGVDVDLDAVRVVVVVVLVGVVVRSTLPDRHTLLADPRHDLAEDVLVLGLVVALVAQALVDVRGSSFDFPSNTAAGAGRGTIGSADPWKTYVGTGIASSAASTPFTRSCSSNASAPNRIVDAFVLSGIGVGLDPDLGVARQPVGRQAVA